MHSTATTPTTEQRLDALELFMQHLVLAIECERSGFTAEHLARWLDVATSRMQATGSTPPPTVAALRALQHKVLA